MASDKQTQEAKDDSADSKQSKSFGADLRIDRTGILMLQQSDQQHDATAQNQNDKPNAPQGNDRLLGAMGGAVR